MTFTLIADYANVVQLGLTVTFLLYYRKLYITWSDSFLSTIGTVDWVRPWRSQLTAEGWLVIGIVFGFTGNTLDNIYWGVTWCAALFHQPTHEHLFTGGPLANLIFRQGFGIWALYCHLRAAKQITETQDYLPNKSYFLGGFATMGLLLLL